MLDEKQPYPHLSLAKGAATRPAKLTVDQPGWKDIRLGSRLFFQYNC
jgi:hypothetical protein